MANNRGKIVVLSASEPLFCRRFTLAGFCTCTSTGCMLRICTRYGSVEGYDMLPCIALSKTVTTYLK